MSEQTSMSEQQGRDPIDRYLDDMLTELRGTAADVRQTLAECESHLRERAASGEAAGRTAEDAAREAVAAFGPVRTVARGFNSAHRPLLLRSLAASAAREGWRLAAVGLTAIGVSGVVAWVMMLLTSTGAVFADAPGTHYGPAACAHFLAVQPSARTCVTAALLEGRDDALVQRAAAGILGLLLIAVWAWRSRHANRHQDAANVGVAAPAALTGVTCFGAAGIFLTGYGIDRAVVDTGSGQWLSAGIVAIAVAIGYLTLLWRRIDELRYFG